MLFFSLSVLTLILFSLIRPPKECFGALRSKEKKFIFFLLFFKGYSQGSETPAVNKELITSNLQTHLVLNPQCCFDLLYCYYLSGFHLALQKQNRIFRYKDK